MKIIFICSSLEQGKDGVGDYTRQLCSELIKEGHNVEIIALYDKYCNKKIEEFQNVIPDVNVAAVRFPLKYPKKQKVEDIKNIVARFDPDWLSLQFVPYGFHNKGLPFKLANMLFSFGKGRKWHIMFHELWIGKPETFSIKLFFTRQLQIHIIQRFINKLQPKVVHTHLPDFFFKLKNIGCNPAALMLFSNIPVLNSNCELIFEKDTFIIGFFSQFKIGKNVVDFLNEFHEQSIASRKKIKIIFIGSSKEKAASAVKIYKSKINFECEFEMTGYLSQQELSKKIMLCNVGITPVPQHALGKSGSVAAFISHGVPVAAPNTSAEFAGKIGFFEPALIQSIIIEPNMDKIDVYKKKAVNASHFIQINTIRKKFLHDLEKSNQ